MNGQLVTGASDGRLQGGTTHIQGGSDMTGTDSACLHTNQSRSYLNHLVFIEA